MSPTFPTLTNPAISRTPSQLTYADITGSCLRTPLLYLPSFSFPACSRGLRGKGVRGALLRAVDYQVCDRRQRLTCFWAGLFIGKAGPAPALNMQWSESRRACITRTRKARWLPAGDRV